MPNKMIIFCLSADPHSLTTIQDACLDYIQVSVFISLEFPMRWETLPKQYKSQTLSKTSIHMRVWRSFFWRASEVKVFVGVLFCLSRHKAFFFFFFNLIARQRPEPVAVALLQYSPAAALLQPLPIKVQLVTPKRAFEKALHQFIPFIGASPQQPAKFCVCSRPCTSLMLVWLQLLALEK